MVCTKCGGNYYRHGMCLKHYLMLRDFVFKYKILKERIDFINTLLNNRLIRAKKLYKEDKKQAHILYCELDAIVHFKRYTENKQLGIDKRLW